MTWSSGLSVTADGTGVVAHAGAVAVRLLADRVGLTGGLSTALARRSFRPVHDRGRVLVDLAVLLADGGEAIADIDVLRHQSQVLGPVASRADGVAGPGRADPGRADAGREGPRPGPPARVGAAAAGGGVPASKVAGTDLGETVVLDVDATLVTVHSEKEPAAATFKGGFGYHPIGVWCDNTQEMLAAMLRPGNAGSNTTADHIAVLTAAIAQVPAVHREEAAGPRGRRRRLARAAGLADRPGRQTGPQRGVFGRVRGHRPGPRPRHQPRAGEGVDPGGRRRRRASVTAVTSPRSPTCST